mmetsp:Transcript_28581/g.68732  ORF Transcript_28581/g.68732 Transcript_28581/m.68732 type:complete len:298 (+) Transcript_28581:769-1662(+)
MIGIGESRHEQRHDALHGEGPPVHEVPVEQVGVGLGGDAIDLENIQQIVVLPVHVPAHVEVLLVRHVHVLHCGAGLQQRNHIHDQLIHVTLGDVLLALLILQHVFQVLGGVGTVLSQPRDPLVDRAIVATRHLDILDLHGLRGRLAGLHLNRLEKLLAVHELLRLLHALPGHAIRGGELAELVEVLVRWGVPRQGHVSHASAVVGLGKIRLQLYGLLSIADGRAKILHLDVAERPIAIEDMHLRVRLRGTLALIDSHAVGDRCSRIVCFGEQIIALILVLRGFFLNLCELSVRHCDL